MRTFGVILSAIVILSLSAGPVRAWSLLEEVVVINPGLSAQLVWELVDSKPYCQSGPTNLDRLSCAIIPDPAEFWIGLDAAGNAYGTINGIDGPGLEYFDIYRRPAGTQLNHLILRVTKRKEPVFGQVTKLQITAGWQIDQTGGTLLLSVTGSCSSATCTAQGDTTDHLGVIRITGLPTLFDLALTYQPPSGLALRMPVRPEGLPSADRVDVYSGAVASLPDLAPAMPLACDVAASAGAGDVVVVVDSLPPPAAGQVRYYLAAVSSGPERRAGRRLTNGVFEGRPVAGLPACP